MELLLIDHVGINVKDLERSAAWYRRVLGFEIFHKFTRTWMIRRGDMRIGLFFRPDAQPIGVELDNAVAITHFAFLTDDCGFKCAQELLTAMEIEFELADSGIALSLFIHDPDGHEIEVTTYHTPAPAQVATPTET